MNFKLNKFSKLNPGFKQFLLKTVVFVGLFIAFTAIIGTKLYANNLLDGWKIEIYGRIGYILLFSIVGFILLYRDRLLRIASFRYRARNGFFIIISLMLLVWFYLFEIYAYLFPITLGNILLVHFLGILIFIFLILGIYGIDFIKHFIKIFKKEISYFLGFAVVTASLMNLVWSSWTYLSLVVSKIVYFLLNIISNNVQLIPPRTLVLGSFGAEIAEACSGVYSIFLFIALYLFIVFLDWKKINKKRAGLLLIPAIIGAFLVNVLRVLTIFIVGAYISKDIAMSLYHSYSGMVFFLIYFAFFWFLFYKWMKNEKINFFPKDSLYRNSLYLMLSTFVMAVFGFVFWVIGARLFPTEQIGLATTLISAMSLLTSFSLLGLNTGLIRYLPTSKDKDKKINTSFTLVAIVTVIISSIFLLFIKTFSPKLAFVHDNLILAFIFIFFMICSSFSTLIESVFIAYRSSKYVLMKNTIFSVLKIVFLFLFVGLGAYGIFSSWVIGIFFGFASVLIILISKFGYAPKFVFYDSIVKKIGKYSFGNYVAGFMIAVPTLVLPLLILNKLGAEFSAYYYMAMMIAAVLFTIPNATSNSLFAEGSHNEKKLKTSIKKSIKIIALLLIPAILITIFLGKYILLFFGQDYSSQGFMFLNVLAISGVFVAVNAVFNSLLRVKKRVKSLIYINLFSAILILGLSYLFINNGQGLLGIGYAYLIGQGVITGIYFLIYSVKKA
ncbi:MAG: archaeosortase/exosortase family protein [Nanoarchaeota archaeon]